MLRRGHFSPIHSENCLVLFTFRLEFLVCLLFFTFLFPSTFPPSSLYLTVHSVQSSIFHTILGALQESTCCPFVIHDFPFNLNSLYSLIRSSLFWPLILIQNIKTLSFLSFFLSFFGMWGRKILILVGVLDYCSKSQDLALLEFQLLKYLELTVKWATG